MYKHTFIRTKKINHAEVGTLLIAQPFWQDESYHRSVILVLEHTYKASTGIILNKPSSLSAGDVLPELRIGLPLYYGGPVDTELVSSIHNYAEVPNAHPLGNNLYFGGDYDYITTMILNKKINLRKIKFYAGFVEWKAGQIDTEIRQNKWWNSDINSQEFFTTMPEDLWPNELINNGHVYGLLNEYPDPCLS